MTEKEKDEWCCMAQEMAKSTGGDIDNTPDLSRSEPETVKYVLRLIGDIKCLCEVIRNTPEADGLVKMGYENLIKFASSKETEIRNSAIRNMSEAITELSK